MHQPRNRKPITIHSRVSNVLVPHLSAQNLAFAGEI